MSHHGSSEKKRIETKIEEKEKKRCMYMYVTLAVSCFVDLAELHCGVSSHRKLKHLWRSCFVEANISFFYCHLEIELNLATIIQDYLKRMEGKSHLTLGLWKGMQNCPVGDLICPSPRRAHLQMNHVSVIHILPTAVCYEEDRLERGGSCCKSSFAAAA